MKRFKFEINITEDDVAGDEFWEDALKKDGTGIEDLKGAIVQALEDSNIFVSSDRSIKDDIVKLVSYSDDNK